MGEPAYLARVQGDYQTMEEKSQKCKRKGTGRRKGISVERSKP